eukprot:scaffold8993_cov207-Skeletonema_marinoi.AAC.31
MHEIGLPDASGPSPRHSQQLGQSAAVPSGLASVELVLCSLDDDDNTVLLVDDVAMERSQEEMVGGGSVIFLFTATSQMSADAYKSEERNGQRKSCVASLSSVYHLAIGSQIDRQDRGLIAVVCVMCEKGRHHKRPKTFSKRPQTVAIAQTYERN